MQLPAKPKLISFKLCPFVQRSVITLLHKNINYEIDYIDLKNKPEWFLKISPLGKVPVLKVGKEVLFESAVINEFLDEVTPPSIHPKDPLTKAKNRAWIEFGSSLIFNQHQFALAKDQKAFSSQLAEIDKKFAQLEGCLGEGPFFNGAKFSLVDTAYAPLLLRLDFLNNKMKGEMFQSHPKVNDWKNTLVSLPEVKRSAVSDLEDLYFTYIRAEGGYFADQWL